MGTVRISDVRNAYGAPEVLHGVSIDIRERIGERRGTLRISPDPAHLHLFDAGDRPQDGGPSDGRRSILT